MNRSYVVGKVYNENKKEFQAVIGHEFRDTPGFFQFFEIGTNGHFRKRPLQNDEIAPISKGIFDKLNFIE